MNKKEKYTSLIQVAFLMALLFFLSLTLYRVGVRTDPIQDLNFNLNDGTVLECKTTLVEGEIECKYPQEEIKTWGPQD